MKIKIQHFLFLSILFFLITSCANTRIAANYPRRDKSALDHTFAHVRFSSNDLDVVISVKKQWFDVEEFKKIKDQKISSIEDSIFPVGQKNALINSIYSFKKLEFEMLHEMENITPNYAFGCLGLVFEKNVTLRLNKEAFLITMTSPDGDVVEIKDQGILVGYSEDGFVKSNYLDSGFDEIEIQWKLQKPDYSKTPNLVFFRAPYKYLNWEISSVSVDYDKLMVVYPGI